MIPKASVQAIRTIRAGNTAQRLNACLLVCVCKENNPPPRQHHQNPKKENPKIQIIKFRRVWENYNIFKFWKTQRPLLSSI